jgi:hypothetical protein
VTAFPIIYRKGVHSGRTNPRIDATRLIFYDFSSQTGSSAENIICIVHVIRIEGVHFGVLRSQITGRQCMNLRLPFMFTAIALAVAVLYLLAAGKMASAE